MGGKEDTPRRCGCQTPFGIHPPLAWLLCFGGAAAFHGIAVTWLFENETQELKKITRIVPLVVTATAVLCFMHVTISDPSRRPASDGETVPDAGGEIPTFGFCPSCDTKKLMKLNTKHCRICNKCISHFDHHCVWLNTCIGARNYWSFMSTCFFVALEMSFAVYLCIHGLIARKDDALTVWYFLSVVICIENFLVALLVGALFFFHVYLQVTCQTTYEWMMTRYYPGRNRFDVVKIRRKNAAKEMRKLSSNGSKGPSETQHVDDNEESSAGGDFLHAATGIGRLKDVVELVPGKTGKEDHIRKNPTSTEVDIKLGGL